MSREEPEQSDTVYSDGIGDTADTDGEPIDDQVGDVRAGRLIIGDIDIGNIDASDPNLDYWPHDVGIDGAGASAEEAAVYVVSDDDLNSPDDTPSRRRTITTGQGHPVETDAADNSADSSTDSLDDLAAFLMHHAYQPTVTDAERLQIFAVVDAYQDGDEPSAVESAMRTIALRFGEHADYRPEWRPQPGSST